MDACGLALTVLLVFHFLLVSLTSWVVPTQENESSFFYCICFYYVRCTDLLIVLVRFAFESHFSVDCMVSHRSMSTRELSSARGMTSSSNSADGIVDAFGFVATSTHYHPGRRTECGYRSGGYGGWNEAQVSAEVALPRLYYLLTFEALQMVLSITGNDVNDVLVIFSVFVFCTSFFL